MQKQYATNNDLWTVLGIIYQNKAYEELNMQKDLQEVGA